MKTAAAVAIVWRGILASLWICAALSILQFIWQFFRNVYVFVIAPRCGRVPNLRKLLLDAENADWAIVTGAGRGIGQGYARALASKGFNVVLIGKRREHLEKTADEINALNKAIETRIVVFDFHRQTDLAPSCQRCRSGSAIATPRAGATPRADTGGLASPRPNTANSRRFLGSGVPWQSDGGQNSESFEATAEESPERKKERLRRRGVCFTSGSKCVGEQILTEAIGEHILERVGILVNNVGIMGGEKNFAQSFGTNFPDAVRFGFEMINVNVKSAVLMTGMVLPIFLRRVYQAKKRRVQTSGEAGGIIINLSSAVAVRPIAGSAIYCGTKAFIDFFSNALHQELSNVKIEKEEGQGDRQTLRIIPPREETSSLTPSTTRDSTSPTSSGEAPLISKANPAPKFLRRRSLHGTEEGGGAGSAPPRRSKTMAEGISKTEDTDDYDAPQGLMVAGSGIIVQTVYPYFVRTGLIPQVARDLFPSILAPDPLYFAHSALNTVGLQSRTNGCFEHAMQDQVYRVLARLLPNSVFDFATDLALRSLGRVNRKYLRTKRRLNAVVFQQED